MRDLTEAERALVERARRTAHVLYEGKETPHRSCGIALAETFHLPTRPYQALRRGGITGAGECGAIKAGELVLGELLGDPDPTGVVTPALRGAIVWYGAEIRRRLATPPDITCNNLVKKFADFQGEDRKAMCTNIAAEVAACVAEALLLHGGTVPT